MHSTHATVEGREAPGGDGRNGVLRLEELNVTFSTADGEVAAVKDFSLTIERGECVGGQRRRAQQDFTHGQPRSGLPNSLTRLTPPSG